MGPLWCICQRYATQIIRRLALCGFPRSGRSMAKLISVLRVHGFELISPMFDGAIVRPLREGADVGEIAPELTRSHGATLRTCDTMGSAAPEEAGQIDESTEAPFPSVGTCRPPRVTLAAPSDPTPDDPDAARTPPASRPKMPRASAPSAYMARRILTPRRYPALIKIIQASAPMR